MWGHKYNFHENTHIITLLNEPLLKYNGKINSPLSLMGLVHPHIPNSPNKSTAEYLLCAAASTMSSTETHITYTTTYTVICIKHTLCK